MHRERDDLFDDGDDGDYIMHMDYRIVVGETINAVIVLPTRLFFAIRPLIVSIVTSAVPGNGLRGTACSG
jgi:hypothetical protein